MEILSSLAEAISNHWPVWVVTITLIVAAVIDGFELRVPNWITFPLIISGWIYSTTAAGLHGDGWYMGLAWSLGGTFVGLSLLLPAYAIGGMGAGDVKLLAGVGAWIHSTHTFYAFGVSVIVGALLAIMMVLARQHWSHHATQFQMIAREICTVRDPEKLAEIARQRKPTMMLLPYGIPIAIGTIMYFAWMNMLV
ncbi:MAG: A24 family peptidase [Planctomycetota bacterium]|nr:A24 family peptidase [Planctomycetota bacterium]MDA1179120.1 A24 family peptidase [Planctomycetota bacterium]